MSCWVVPTIAAELWAVPLQQVLDGMQAGHIPSKIDAGFTFVDVAPESPKIQTPAALRAAAPPTFTVVTEEEVAALTGAATEEVALSDAEESSLNLGDWRQARNSARQLRRRPIAA